MLAPQPKYNPLARPVRPRPSDPSEARLLTRTGVDVRIRPIRPADAEALVRAFSRLTPEQVRMRLFYTLTELPLEVARRLCHPDPEREVACVVTRPHDPEIIGEARILIDRSAGMAEFAIVIDPEWTGIGVAHGLMTRLIHEARQQGLSEIWGDILLDNRPMLDLMARLGFTLKANRDDSGIIRASLMV